MRQNESDSIHELSIVWIASEQKAFLEALDRIEHEDVGTAKLVLRRVDKSISLIAVQPILGAFTAMSGVRRYPIPQTGHTINYRVVHGVLMTLLWYRQRRRIES